MKTQAQVAHYLNNIIAGEQCTDPELDAGHPMGPEHADAIIEALEWVLEIPSESRTRLYLGRENAPPIA